MAVGDSRPVGGDHLLVTMFVENGEQVAMIGMHFVVVSVTGTGETLNGIASEINGAVRSPMAALLPTTADYVGLTVRNVSHTGITVGAAKTSGGAGPGTDTSGPLPTQAALVVTKLTDTSGPGGRGRNYIPFPPRSGDDTTSAGSPNAAYIALVDTMYAALAQEHICDAGGGNVTTIDPEVFHEQTTTGTPIVGYRVNPKWGTQKRRGDYGRPNGLPPELG